MTLLVCWLVPFNSARAHPVPDGVIFRGIQVVVWSDRIEIRYQVGLNDQMVQQELRAALPPDAPIPSDGGQALRAYRDVLFPKLPEKLTVMIDAQPQTLKLRRADIVRQLHIQIELVYRIDFAATSTPAHFLLIDDNFAGVPGYHLAAIKSRGLVEIPETDAIAVLSRLSREPETEEDVRILSTPVRRVEAMIAAIAPDNPLGDEGDLIAATADRSKRFEQPAASREAIPRTGSASEGTESTGGQETRIEEVASSGEPHAQDANADRLVWPFLGGLLILVAVIWMFLILRRS